MIVLDLKFKPNKKTCDIVFDDGEIINLTSEAMVKYRIYKEQEINSEVLSLAISESDRAKALEKSINYLSKGYRSERQLKQYLREKMYNEDIQSFVVDKLKEYNYINDENLANLFVQSSAKKMGINKIKNKLYEKGINKTIIEDSLQNVDNQFDICLQMGQKKWSSIINTKREFDDKNEEYKFNQSAKAKLSRYLFSQGFEWEVIKSVVQKLTKSNEDYF